MQSLPDLLKRNREWSESMKRQDPDFFSKLARQQAPEYLWIGCSDSRVPANQIVGLAPGEVFVHRNIANVVVHSDFNCLSVLEYAVCVLKVKHVIVCGHYGCGGVAAAMQNRQLGLIDNWLRHIRDVRNLHAGQLDSISNPQKQLDRLCELNVLEQVNNVCSTTIVQRAWEQGQELAVHAWIYALQDGLIRDLKCSVDNVTDVPEAYKVACPVGA